MGFITLDSNLHYRSYLVDIPEVPKSTGTKFLCIVCGKLLPCDWLCKVNGINKTI